MTSRLRRPHALAAVAAVALSVALTGCGSSGGDAKSDSGADLVSAGKLTVCSDVPYAPFEDFDKSSTIGFKGFDVDIVTQVAKSMGLDLVYKDSDFDALQSGLALKSGQCDLAASAMTITDERKKNIDFSDPYYDSEQSLLVATGSPIKTIADLSGKKVGVQKGTTGKSYAEDNATGAKVVTFPSDAEEFQALQAGQVDALLQDLPVNIEHTKDGTYAVVEKYQTDEQYGLAIAKGNAQLVKDVNAALSAMRSDGTYDKIYDTYFSTN